MIWPQSPRKCATPTSGSIRVTSIPFFARPPRCADRRLLGRLPLVVPGGRARRSTTLRMFGVTAGYHRYFSHRSYKTSRGFQFVLALLGDDLGAEGRAVVGGASPRSPQVLRPAARTSTRRVQRGFWWSHVGWILSPQVRRDQVRAHQGLRASIPSCAGSTSITWCRRSLLAVALFAHRRRAAARLGLLRLDGAALARHLHDQLAVARVRHAPLRDHRRQPEQLAARAHHLRRGLAQQPPLLPVARPTRASSGGRSTLTYYTLKMLSWVGLVWDLRTPPKHIRDSHKAPRRRVRRAGDRVGPAARRRSPARLVAHQRLSRCRSLSVQS